MTILEITLQPIYDLLGEIWNLLLEVPENGQMTSLLF